MILVPEYLSGNITTVVLGKAKKEPLLLGPLQQLRKDIKENNLQTLENRRRNVIF